LELEDGVSVPNGSDAAQLKAELELTSRLIDRVLFLFHGLSAGDIERVEDAQASA
jgi:hypothetical protein